MNQRRILKYVRCFLIPIFITLACVKPVEVVNGSEIEIPETEQYCLVGIIGKSIPFIACVPDEKLCDRAFNTAKKIGDLAELKVVAKCTLTSLKVE